MWRSLPWEVSEDNPDSKVHGVNMGPIWGRQDPGGPHEPCYLGMVVKWSNWHILGSDVPFLINCSEISGLIHVHVFSCTSLVSHLKSFSWVSAKSRWAVANGSLSVTSSRQQQSLQHEQHVVCDKWEKQEVSTVHIYTVSENTQDNNELQNVHSPCWGRIPSGYLPKMTHATSFQWYGKCK